MGLVDDEGVVFEQVTVGADLGQLHAVGDKLHQRLRRRLVIEADLGANLPSPLDTEFFGNRTSARLACEPLGIEIEAELPADARSGGDEPLVPSSMVHIQLPLNALSVLAH